LELPYTDGGMRSYKYRLIAHGDSLLVNGIRIRPPFARTDRRKNFFAVRVCEKWNALPAEVKSARTVDKFKCAYRLFTAVQPSEAREQAGDQ
jgi:hypothetical protein